MGSWFSKLGCKLLGASLLGLGLAFAAYTLTVNLAVPWLLHSERLAAFWQDQEDRTVRLYQEYIVENHITVAQAAENQEDSPLSGGFYTVMIGDVGEMSDREAAAASWSGRTEKEVLPDISLSWSAWAEEGELSDAVWEEPARFVMKLRQIQCADGVLYISSIPMDMRYESLGRAAALLLGLAVFCAVVAPCIFRLLHRIEALSRETGLLMGGDLDHRIRAPGRDELSRLGGDIERLRLSVVERIEGEREAVCATNRLITGLSHDLRTPLTKLIGYLEILGGRCQSEEEREKYLRLAKEKAEQLKGMTDQLFDRAQVAGGRESLADTPELLDGAQLLGQILSELCGDLRREGFESEPPVFEEPFQLYVRTEDVVRVDNLFSNLCKYADRGERIRFCVTYATGAVAVQVVNQVIEAAGGDSHGVGLPNMAEMMERGGGRLETGREGERFYTKLVFMRC